MLMIYKKHLRSAVSFLLSVCLVSTFASCKDTEPYISQTSEQTIYEQTELTEETSYVSSVITSVTSSESLITETEITYIDTSAVDTEVNITETSSEETTLYLTESPITTTEETVTSENTPPEVTTLKISVLNVGQSSCTVLESDDMCAVIDAADSIHSKEVVNYLLNSEITYIDYLIFTHYDDDHIGAADDILSNSRITVCEILGPDYRDKSKIKNGKIKFPSLGECFSFGFCNIEIIAPKSKNINIPNENSIAMIISDEYEHQLYIGGDSGEDSEKKQKELITSSVDIYIVNHHGSATSSSAAFLHTIHPDYAIISCGKNNKYGHPDKNTLDKLKRIGCEIHRTDKMQNNQNIIAYFKSSGVTFE